MSQDRPIYLCKGSDCRKKSAALKEVLEKHGEVRQVRCQKICKGPIFGLEVNGELEWFSKVSGKKMLRCADALLSEDVLGPALVKRRVRKRRGRLRK